MYGCLSLLLLGVVFIFIAAVMGLLQILFSIRRSANAFRQTINGEGPRKKKKTTRKAGNPSSGTADGTQNHRNDNGKFFEKNEGEYVDFEDIPSK